MAAKKIRLDQLLIEKGIFTSRERAKAAIMSGKVFIDGKRFDKAGEKVSEDSLIEYKGEEMPYVSRGGYKLSKAMSSFNIELTGMICMDIGASTGGFTDCMLQNGAHKVYSIDVGYGQLSWKLRIDPRVVCLERTNIRYITSEQVPDLVDFASIDVSFISLKKVIPAALSVMKDNGEIVALIKPQFEAGREKVGKKGVVKEKSTHIEVIQGIIDFIKEKELYIKGLSFSPIKGPEGNIEYLIYFSKKVPKDSVLQNIDVEAIVDASHGELNSIGRTYEEI